MMPKEAFNKSEFTAGVRIQSRNELGCSFSRFIKNNTWPVNVSRRLPDATSHIGTPNRPLTRQRVVFAIVFEERRASVERERAYLLAHRIHDEFWYAAQF